VTEPITGYVVKLGAARASVVGRIALIGAVQQWAAAALEAAAAAGHTELELRALVWDAPEPVCTCPAVVRMRLTKSPGSHLVDCPMWRAPGAR